MLETFCFLEESSAWRCHPRPPFPVVCPVSRPACWLWRMLKAAAMLLLLAEWFALSLAPSDRAFLPPREISQWQECCLPLCWPDPMLLSSHLATLVSVEFCGGGFLFPVPLPFGISLPRPPPTRQSCCVRIWPLARAVRQKWW